MNPILFSRITEACLTWNKSDCFLFLCCRCCLESLSQLDLPSQVVECVTKLAGDLRVLCATQVFEEAIDGKQHFL